MNKNRARTQRRLTARRAGSSLWNEEKGKRIKLPKSITKSMQRGIDFAKDHTRPTPFEVQVRDKSGRWRKAAGVARVATWGLAEVAAKRLRRPVGDARVRNVLTGETWDAWRWTL